MTARHVKGYIRVYEPSHPLAGRDGYVLEHRKVIHDAGIEVPAGCLVHHRNDVKDDNRLENLEVKPIDTHTRDHVHEAGVVINQHGAWPVAKTDEQRRERRREVWRQYRARAITNGTWRGH
jgi:hypothetical protein